MSVVGDWGMTLTVSQVGAFQWCAELTHTAAERKPGVRSISIPTWTINGAGLIGFLALWPAIVGLDRRLARG